MSGCGLFSLGLAGIGLGGIAYMPLSHVLSAEAGPQPGQLRPVVFYSPDGDECEEAQPHISALVAQQGWEAPARVDSRLVENESVRLRLDKAFRVSEEDRWHVPAIFRAQGHVIGLERIESAADEGLLSGLGAPDLAGSGSLWSHWAEFALAGIWLLVLAAMVGTGAAYAVPAALALLSLVFLISGLSNLLDVGSFTDQVRAMRIIPAAVVALAWLVGVAEAALVIGLVHRRLRRAAVTASGMMLGFTALVSPLGLYLVLRNGTSNCVRLRSEWPVALLGGYLLLALPPGHWVCGTSTVRGNVEGGRSDRFHAASRQQTQMPRHCGALHAWSVPPMPLPQVRGTSHSRCGPKSHTRERPLARVRRMWGLEEPMPIRSEVWPPTFSFSTTVRWSLSLGVPLGDRSLKVTPAESSFRRRHPGAAPDLPREPISVTTSLRPTHDTRISR